MNALVSQKSDVKAGQSRSQPINRFEPVPVRRHCVRCDSCSRISSSRSDMRCSKTSTLRNALRLFHHSKITDPIIPEATLSSAIGSWNACEIGPRNETGFVPLAIVTSSHRDSLATRSASDANMTHLSPECDYLPNRYPAYPIILHEIRINSKKTVWIQGKSYENSSDSGCTDQ